MNVVEVWSALARMLDQYLIYRNNYLVGKPGAILAFESNRFCKI